MDQVTLEYSRIVESIPMILTVPLTRPKGRECKCGLRRNSFATIGEFNNHRSVCPAENDEEEM